jgi:ABC-2 type transport system permease protein
MSTTVAPVGSDSETPAAELREISRRPSPLKRMVDVWRHRELLRNLVRKDLKVKYKSSVLGFFWTLLNPALYLVIFSIVFQEILRVQVPYYAVFLLSGLLVWNLFSASVGGGTGAVVDNAGLVQKVWFPREVLPLATIGAALMHFFFQLLVLIGALAIFRKPPEWEFLPALIPALLALLILAAALAIALSAVNVYLRDTGHLIELVLLAWFWLSAIVYPYRDVADRLGDKAYLLLLNPIISIVVLFQRAIYNPPAEDGIVPDAGLGWYLRNIAIVGGVSLVLLLFALWLFGRLEDNLAEEI